MKLSEWAKQQGISYKTAWRWYTEGKLPVPA
ncbi:MAG: IS607 family transposase, partial [Syntrophorhabdaceae bacterium]|nr:IS607 family transposase [Syntrophorhabdaceae bacterium]